MHSGFQRRVFFVFVGCLRYFRKFLEHRNHLWYVLAYSCLYALNSIQDHSKWLFCCIKKLFITFIMNNKLTYHWGRSIKLNASASWHSRLQHALAFINFRWCQCSGFSSLLSVIYVLTPSIEIMLSWTSFSTRYISDNLACEVRN